MIFRQPTIAKKCKPCMVSASGADAADMDNRRCRLESTDSVRSKQRLNHNPIGDLRMYQSKALGSVTLVLAISLCSGAVLAQDLGGMGMDAAMDSAKEKAIDKAIDSGAGMAKDQAKSAVGMDGGAADADEAAAAAEESAEGEAEAAAESAEGEVEAAEEEAPQRIE
ncbi:MAG: hypothetical protein K9L70_12145 [Thiohalocapsa sp.]|nr:hypothetical protein [Thiohalocapsa sp.]